MTLGKKQHNATLVHLLGLVGVLCVGIAAAGFFGAFEPSGKVLVVDEPAVDESVAAEQVAAVGESAQVAPVPVVAAPRDARALDSHYPLEVGRFWVYASEDVERGTRTEVERRIVRRESKADQELFYFSDGTVAFRQDDKVFEMGPEGGVNVIPWNADPYVYRSEGLLIEKQVGNKDTVMILGQQRYPHCIQVITRFRPADQPEQAMRAYASYYARGIGLVGREIWPPAPGATPAQTLMDYGPRKM